MINLPTGLIYEKKISLSQVSSSWRWIVHAIKRLPRLVSASMTEAEHERKKSLICHNLYSLLSNLCDFCSTTIKDAVKKDRKGVCCNAPHDCSVLLSYLSWDDFFSRSLVNFQLHLKCIQKIVVLAKNATIRKLWLSAEFYFLYIWMIDLLIIKLINLYLRGMHENPYH